MGLPALTLDWLLDLAVRDHYLQDNPIVPSMRLASACKTDADGLQIEVSEVLSEAQLAKVIECAPISYFKALFLAAFLTGMREGELLALRWSDLDDGKIAISRSLSWKQGAPHFGPPKSIAGRRIIPMQRQLQDALSEWARTCPRSSDGSLDLVFPRADGTPMPRWSMLKVGWYPTLKNARLPRVKFHSLRHSYASEMLKRREPLTKVSRRLGHADTQITARVYAHWITTPDEVTDADLTLPINEGKAETRPGVEFLLNMPLAKVEDTA